MCMLFCFLFWFFFCIHFQTNSQHSCIFDCHCFRVTFIPASFQESQASLPRCFVGDSGEAGEGRAGGRAGGCCHLPAVSVLDTLIQNQKPKICCYWTSSAFPLNIKSEISTGFFWAEKKNMEGVSVCDWQIRPYWLDYNEFIHNWAICCPALTGKRHFRWELTMCQK